MSAVPGPRLHAGFVMKRAVRTATKNDWKRRWLVLMPTEITYAEAEGEKAKNSLPISGTCRVRACEYHFKNEVELYNPTTNVALYFTTETTDQMTEWIAKIQAAIDALAPAKAEDSAAKARAEASTKALQEAAARAISADAASRAAVFATARAAESERAAAVRSQRMSVRTWNPLAAAAGGAGAGSGAGAMPTTPGGRPLSGAMGGAGGLIGGIGGIAGRARASVFSLKKPDAGTDAMLASARPGQTIAVSSVEGLVSFGAGDAGQLGDGRLLPDGSCKPVRIDWSKAMKGPPIDIAAGTTHAAVVSADSGLYVFGDNSHGQLGEPATKLKSALRPTIVSGLRSHRVLGVACGTYHTMALTEGGALWAWGTGEKGQLGLGSAARYVPEPRRLDRVAPEKADGTGLCFARVFAGRYTSAGITDKGAAYVWGGGQWGKLGAGPEHASPDTVHWEPDAPVAALVGTPVRDIALGDIFSAFLVAPTPADAATASASATGSTLLVCGALGLTAEDWAARRDAVTWPHPTATFDRRPVVARIAAGRAHLAIISDASLYTAGRGWLGSTHGEDVSEEPMPVPELDVEGIVDVSCGSMHTVVRTLDGRLFAFGANVTGALGTGHFTDMAKPMPGITLDSAHYGKLAAGADFTVAITCHGLPDLLTANPAFRSAASAGAAAARGEDAAPVPTRAEAQRRLTSRMTWKATGVSNPFAAAAMAALKEAEEEEAAGAGAGAGAGESEGSPCVPPRELVIPGPPPRLPGPPPLLPGPPPLSPTQGPLKPVPPTRPKSTRPRPSTIASALAGAGAASAGGVASPLAASGEATAETPVSSTSDGAEPLSPVSEGGAGGDETPAPSGTGAIARLRAKAAAKRAAELAAAAAAAEAEAAAAAAAAAAATSIASPAADATSPAAAAGEPSTVAATSATAAVTTMVLPPGWARFQDDSPDATPYYYCESTNETVWQLFWELRTEDGTPYFLNVESQETQWERPEEGAAIVTAAE